MDILKKRIGKLEKNGGTLHKQNQIELPAVLQYWDTNHQKSHLLLFV